MSVRTTLLSMFAYGALAVLVALTFGGCNRRVFTKVEGSCDTTLVGKIDVPTQKAADVLIVVDNSGSMQDEQDNLVANFLNTDASACPLQDLANIPDQYKNPPRALYTNGGDLAGCGFIQLLAAFENNFRVGVITTDVSLCDDDLGNIDDPSFCANSGNAFCLNGPDNCAAFNDVGAAGDQCFDDGGSDAWGFRPQRDCLQPDGFPGRSGNRKFMSADDIAEGGDAADLATRFRRTLQNIRIFGSGFERGLDAMSYFLNGEDDRGDGACDDDFSSWRRDDASLVVIFLSDEEDCSHALGDASFDDELTNGQGDSVDTCGAFTPAIFPSTCYNTGSLSPVSKYIDALAAVDANAKLAIIAGGVGDTGSVEPSGCRVGNDGKPVGGTDVCVPAQGSSNDSTKCGPNPTDSAFVAARGCDGGGGGNCDIPCCTGDAGGRYFEFADQWGADKALTDSICNESFRGTMIEIAAFIAAVDYVQLAEPPANERAIIVELTRSGSDEADNVPRLEDGESCATDDGWELDPDIAGRINLCGSFRPGPGDQINVRAAGAAESACSG